MPLSNSFLQGSLAVTMAVSTIGTYIALTPPNPNSVAVPSTGDSIRMLSFANGLTIKAAMTPFGLLSLHTCCLVFFYPNIPSSILRHGAQNGLNTNLIRWSAATSIPLALILCAGIPLRLVPYASLGKNFTFTLTEPDRLVTTGIYHYVQHPSYTGLVTLLVCSMVLLGRNDGVLSCWIPPRLYQAARTAKLVMIPIWLSILMLGVRTRVSEEELMLRAEFGAEWEKWHAATARFIPWVL